MTCPLRWAFSPRGGLRPIRGALAMTSKAALAGRAFILPFKNAEEAALVEGAETYPQRASLQVCAHLAGTERLQSMNGTAQAVRAPYPDFSDVKGQAQAKRALEI